MTYLLKYTRNRRAIPVFFAMAIIVYLTMVFGTLAQIEQMAGSRPFDLRPAGYSFDAAKGFLNALGKEGRWIYLTRQIPLDTAYPALFALSIASALFALLGYLGFRSKWVNIACLIPFIAAIADYSENALIVVILLKWPDISPWVITIASAVTVFKSSLVTASFIMFTLAGIVALGKFILGADSQPTSK